jgi:hypothetical protein
MRTLRTGLVVAALALFGVTACADLEVTNPNAPDAGRALSSAGDIESLIGGAFNTWFGGVYDYSGPGLFLSNASFQHTAPWANAGMEKYARLPRVSIVNDPADPYYGNFTYPWYSMYSALAAVADGLRAINNNPDIADDLGAEAVSRAQAYGKFVQGVSHGNLAILYDQGFIVDETTDISTPQAAVDYNAMMDAAQGYLDEAAALASGESWTIDGQWMSVDVSADLLAELAHSYAARFRAAVARTPAERAAVNWSEVIADVDAAITEDWIMDMDPNLGWYNEVIDYGTYPGWAENPYFVMGMADQSGNYDRWLAQPLSSRIPNPDLDGDGTGDALIVITPDTRFPQGATVAEQTDNPGTLYVIPTWGIGNVWARPDRGTWRWSYYWHIETEEYTYWNDFNFPEIDYDEMQLLKAEGLYHQGDMAGAAAIINVTRTAAGLNATDAAGTNTSCVPNLPDGDPGATSCGDLWEMLKWEKRMQNRMKGLFGAPWYFDSRGWGDLYRGTYLQFPAPCRELQVLNILPCYTFGGGEEFSAEVSSYGWPDQ